MNAKHLACVALPLAVAACGGGLISVRATDGTMTRDMVAAVRTSAAHDLGCPADSVDVTNITVDVTYEYIAVGCGIRADYRIPVHSIYEATTVVLVSRSPSGAPLPR